MQTITGFFKYYSKPLVTNLLNDEKRAVNVIDISDASLASASPDVCSLRLDQCIKQAEADVSLYLASPDFSDTAILNMVNDFAMEYVYTRIGVVPVPDSIKDTCDKHRKNLLGINQQTIDALSLTQSASTSIFDCAIEETVLFDYD